MQRTSCSCETCQVGCKTLPGALVPADLIKMQQHIEPDASLTEFADKYLVVSSGARILNPQTRQAMSVPSLAPKQRSDGTCIFYNRQGRCDIHQVSPFGCSMFDTHETESVSTPLVRDMVLQQYESHCTGGVYHQLCQYLYAKGQHATPLEDRRRAYEEMLNKPQKENDARSS